ncbi:MAG: DUF3185 family protein [Deltaproteobacteria bacterium]|nr:DUF3185 family protein [Deltaproteobacteria bacterium]
MIKKITGILFHTAGVVMLTLAYKEYYSVAAKVSKLVKGAPPEKVLILLSGGIVCTMIGLFLIYRAPRR